MNTLSCKNCKTTKSVFDFPKDHRNRSGYNTRCKVCENARRKQKATYRFRYTPDMTPEAFKVLLEEQQGVCAICNSPPSEHRRLCVDHDHVTGKIRGLLCNRCNMILGQWQDDKQLLNSALSYLAKYS